MTHDPALIRIIHQAMSVASRYGGDHIGQVWAAVAAVLTERPQMTAGEARALMEQLGTV